MLAYSDGPAADLAFRRGWTHGVAALVVLPFVLTGAMLLLDRAGRRIRRAALPSGVRGDQLLFLSTIAILTHPVLDTLNSYGLRWLVPFSTRWFYGDTLFIVDPWLWIVLSAGVLLSGDRRRRPRRAFGPGATGPARSALVAALVYVLGMALSGIAARQIARRELEALGTPVEGLMVAPRLVTPFTRDVVAAQGNSYQVGIFRWLSRPHLDPASLRSYPRPRPDDAGLAAARATELGRRFLGWARFPVVRVERRSGSAVVQLVDLRYARQAGTGFGTASVPLATPPAFSPPPDTLAASPPDGPAARPR